MYSVFVFLCTLSEMVGVVAAYGLQSKVVFDNLLIYGSPFYLIMHILGHDSAIVEGNPLYLGFIGFHVLKYFAFFRSQMVENNTILRTLAIIFEGLYLGLSTYYSL